MRTNKMLYLHVKLWKDKMIEWLNQNIGTDTATYIGVVVSIIGILYGCKQIKKHHTQSQSGGGNSVNIQGGRDVNVGKIRK